jgi:hypothetical protein
MNLNDLSDSQSEYSDLGPEGMADSVTRHALFADRVDFINHGIDTLDLGLYVEWGPYWNDLKDVFNREKERARETNGHVIERENLRNHIFLPGGQRNYRFHLQFPEYHSFIAISEKGVRSPNVYISFLSQALHLDNTPEDLLNLVNKDILAFGGTIQAHKVSRCDLYKDFRIQGGIKEDFLLRHMVSKTRTTNTYRTGNVLETFYAGGKRAPLQIRIYDKGKQISNTEDEERWKLIWFTDDCTDIWRVEAQIRRTVLKQFAINTIEDLRKKKTDLWQYITGSWFSLRNLDNPDSSRRSMHEFWSLVLDSSLFGNGSGAKRITQKDRAGDLKWYLSRIIGLTISWAALAKKYNWDDSIHKLTLDLTELSSGMNFKEAIQKRSIEMGIEVKTEGVIDRESKKIRGYFG